MAFKKFAYGLLFASSFASGTLAGCGFDESPPAAGTAGTGGPSGVAGTSGGAGATGVAGSTGTAGTGPSPDGGAGTGVDANFDPTMPTLLSQTGLYADIAMDKVAGDVHAFTPQYPLWSDTASKRRWIWLPSGQKIDTTEMSFWRYPKGTKLWKEFTREGKRLETRLLLKNGVGEWFMMAYKWNADQKDAVAVRDGDPNSGGTQHDIPSSEQCGTCHLAMVDTILGFTAVQLSHDLPANSPELNLEKLKMMNLLTAPPTASVDLPGDATAKAALGYLHSNCGICHNEQGKVYSSKVKIDLWTHLERPITTVETTAAYLSMVCDSWPGTGITPITSCPTGHALGTPLEGTISMVAGARRITPGDPAKSAIHELMALREAGSTTMRQMPPLATKMVDDVGLKAVDDWIKSLPK